MNKSFQPVGRTPPIISRFLQISLGMITILGGPRTRLAWSADPIPAIGKTQIVQSAFHENDGVLKVTDTRLRFGKSSFFMDQARYQASVDGELGGKAPIDYRYKDHHLSFTPLGLRWSGTPTMGEKETIKAGVARVKGRLVESGDELDGRPEPQAVGKGVIYRNAYGPGVDLGVLTENLVMRKITKIDRRDRLGPIPQSAPFLELPFALDADADVYFKARFGGDTLRTWDKKEVVRSHGERIEFGRRGGTTATSFIKPAHAWDSAGNKIPLTLELGRQGGRFVLTKRIPVNWINDATFPIYTDATVTFDTAVFFESAETTDISVTALDATHVVIAYRDHGNSSYGTAVVGTVSGTTINFGSPQVFNSGGAIAHISIATLDATHVIFGYQDPGNASYGTAVVGTISGTIINFGSPQVFNSASTDDISVIALDATHALIAYADWGSSSYGTAILGVISGSTLSFGSSQVFYSSGADEIVAAALDATHVVIAFSDEGTAPGNSRAIVGTISGTAITFGSPQVFFSFTTSEISITSLNATQVVIAYRGTGTGMATVGTISGPSIAFSNPQFFSSADCSHLSIVALDATHVVIAYRDHGNSFLGTVIDGTISGTAIAVGSDVVFEPNIASFISDIAATALDASRFVIGYKNASNADYGTAIVGTAVNTTPDAPSSLGPANHVDGSSTTDNTPTLDLTQSDSDATDTLKFRIQIDDTSNFSSPVVDYSSPLLAQGVTHFTVGQAVAGGSYTLGVPGQTLAATRFYWRVMSEDNGSAQSGYTTANAGGVAFVVNTVPDTPSNLGPANYVDGSNATDNTPTLSFTQSDPNGIDTLRYRIQIDNNGDFLSPEVDYQSGLAAQGAIHFTVGQAAGAGTYSVGTSGQMLATARYHWRVMSEDSNAAVSAYASANSGAVAFAVTLELGESCTQADDCFSAFCVDGVCCATDCAAGSNGDCQACSVAAGAAIDGTCGAVNALTLCRPAGDSCDFAETCDGISTACPVDVHEIDDALCNDDGLTCTGSNSCQGGICSLGQPVDCDDLNECTNDVCGEPDGSCSHTDLADGTPCTGGLCSGGVCAAIVPDAGVDSVAPTVDSGVPQPDAPAVDLVASMPDSTIDAAVSPTDAPPSAADATVDTVLDTVPAAPDGSPSPPDTMVDATQAKPDTIVSVADAAFDTHTVTDADAITDDAPNPRSDAGSGLDAAGLGENAPEEGGCAGCVLAPEQSKGATGLLWSLLFTGYIVARRRRHRR